MSALTRKKGYYWCRAGKGWALGYFCSSDLDKEVGFLFNGGQKLFKDNELDEIREERLVEPTEREA